MSEIQQITNYDTNLQLILEQYRQSVNLQGILSADNNQADDLETALFEIRDLFYLDTSEGVQLDVIGSVFNVDREGASDTDYRAAISAKAAIAGSGEPEAIIETLIVLFGATFVTYIPGWPAVPAAYYLLTDATVTLSDLEKISPSGVQPIILTALEYQDSTNVEFEDGDLVYLT